MSQRVRPADAAKEIGCCLGYLYERMRLGDWDLGEYVKPKGRKRATVFIFRDKLDRFLGKRPESNSKSIETEKNEGFEGGTE